MRLTWAQPEDLVPAEFVALREQGADESAVRDIEQRWIAAGGSAELQTSGASATPAPPALRELGRDLLDELADLQPESAREPNEWADILALMPGRTAPGERANVAHDRVLGAWTGRSVGCLLGKPVEKLPREAIEAIATATGNWPIRTYFTAVGLPADIAERWPWNRRSAPTSLVENIDGMPEDDDLNFAILALELLETHGSALTTDDVATAWLAGLPGGRVFTAERAAYRNLLDARPVPETATRHNPFREWIGALIRTDAYGWAAPGDPVEASRLAWTDARLSHTRNGLYGAMWAAALCSAAIVGDDPTAVLDVADSVVPPASRLAAAIATGRSLGAEVATGALDERAALDALHDAFRGMHWVHTLNNAALIACAIEAGARLDASPRFDRGIAIAVAGGWDTDSAGATVGSVLGAIGGAEAIDPAWSRPIRSSIATSLPGGAERSIPDLAMRTLAVQEGMRR